MIGCRRIKHAGTNWCVCLVFAFTVVACANTTEQRQSSESGASVEAISDAYCGTAVRGVSVCNEIDGTPTRFAWQTAPLFSILDSPDVQAPNLENAIRNVFNTHLVLAGFPESVLPASGPIERDRERLFVQLIPRHRFLGDKSQLYGFNLEQENGNLKRVWISLNVDAILDWSGSDPELSESLLEMLSERLAAIALGRVGSNQPEVASLSFPDGSTMSLEALLTWMHYRPEIANSRSVEEFRSAVAAMAQELATSNSAPRLAP